MWSILTKITLLIVKKNIYNGSWFMLLFIYQSCRCGTIMHKDEKIKYILINVICNWCQEYINNGTKKLITDII